MTHGLANIGHIEANQDQSGQADGHIDKEDPAPRAIGDKEPAQDWTDHRPQQGGHGQIGHGPDQIGLLDGLEQDQPPDRQHHRSSRAAQHASEHELREGLGQAAEHAGDGVDANGRAKDRAAAIAIGQPAADGQEHRRCQEIGGDGELKMQRALVQGLAHCRKGIDDHRRIERLDHHRRADDQGHQRAERGARRPGLRLSGDLVGHSAP